MMVDECQGCQYWVRGRRQQVAPIGVANNSAAYDWTAGADATGDFPWGECRKSAPIAGLGRWEPTHQNDWCGDFGGGSAPVPGG
jgi:hypothetical protein